MKAGWKTTEFWLTLAASVIGGLMASGLLPADSQWEKLAGLGVMVLASLGYTSSRGAAKRREANKDANH